jgi:hypothetical protein
LQQSLALPESRLLSRFFEAIQIGHALHTLRDVNHACADRKRNKELDRQTREFSQNTKTIAHVQTKLEWLEVFFAGIYATEVSRIITELKDVPKDTAIWIVVGSGVVAALAILLLLRPWEPGTHGDGYEGS